MNKDLRERLLSDAGKTKDSEFLTLEIISTERSNLTPVYIAVALDLASVSISAPYLVYYIQTFVDDISYVSYTLSVFAIFSVLGSFAMGRFSDQYGRKKALVLCICGNAAALLLSAFAKNIFIFILSRACKGLSSSSAPIAYTYITERAKPEEITQKLSYLMGTLMLLNTAIPALSAGLIFFFNMIGLELQMQYRLAFLISAVVSATGGLYAYYAVEPARSAKKHVNQDVPVPWMATFMLLLINACVMVPLFGQHALVPIFWKDQFNIGDTFYAIYLTIGGLFGAFAAFQLKQIIDWFGLFECLFLGLFIIACTHSSVGLFSENNHQSISLHVFFLTFGSTSMSLGTIVNILAGLYAPVEHRNFVMSVVSCGMWLSYFLVPYIYINTYKYVGLWQPFVVGGILILSGWFPGLYLRHNHEFYLYKKPKQQSDAQHVVGLRSVLSAPELSYHFACQSQTVCAASRLSTDIEPQDSISSLPTQANTV